MLNPCRRHVFTRPRPTADGDLTEIPHCTSPDFVTALRYAASLPNGGDLTELDQLKRRSFITLLGAVLAAWPLAAHAQQPDRMRRIGVLMNAAADDPEGQARNTAFVQALLQLGWTDGGNAHIETRWGTDAGSTRKYAAELVALAPDVILATASTATSALQETTRTVPIVFVNVTDPVGAGYVESLARPGGNITGFSSFEYEFSGKWLELLKEIAPGVTRVAVLRDTSSGSGVGQYAIIQAVAPSLGVELRPIDMRDAGEIERAVVAFARVPNSGLICRGPIVGGSSRSDHHACGPPPIARGVPSPVFRPQRRTDLLRA